MKRVKSVRAVITGGAGFIGSHLVDILKDKYDILVIDNLSAGRRDNLPNNTSLLVADMADPNCWDREIPEALIDADIIIDCAAQVSTFESVTNPYKDFETNNYGKFMLLETLRKTNDDALIIYTSSRSVHGNIPYDLVCDETFPYRPSSFYNTNKWYVENLLKLYHEFYGMKYYVVRPANVYGPRMPNKGQYGFVCRWLAYALQDKPIPIWGSGTQTRDFTYVTDIAKAYPMLIEKKPPIGETYLLCTGVETSLIKLATTIFGTIGKFPGWTFLEPKKGDIQRFAGSYAKAERELGWSPDIDLSHGIKLTADWVRQNLDRYKEYNLT